MTQSINLLYFLPHPHSSLHMYVYERIATIAFNLIYCLQFSTKMIQAWAMMVESNFERVERKNHIQTRKHTIIVVDCTYEAEKWTTISARGGKIKEETINSFHWISAFPMAWKQWKFHFYTLSRLLNKQHYDPEISLRNGNKIKGKKRNWL